MFEFLIPEPEGIEFGIFLLVDCLVFFFGMLGFKWVTDEVEIREKRTGKSKLVYDKETRSIRVRDQLGRDLGDSKLKPHE